MDSEEQHMSKRRGRQIRNDEKEMMTGLVNIEQNNVMATETIGTLSSIVVRDPKLERSSRIEDSFKNRRLINTVNSCYINSPLQSLANIEAFTSKLRQVRKYLNDRKHDIGTLNESGKNAIELIYLASDICDVLSGSSKTEKSVERSTLLKVRNLMGYFDPSFNNLEQQDAHQFIFSFLSNISKFIIALARTLYHLDSPTTPICSVKPSSFLKKNSPLYRLNPALVFHMRTKLRMICCTCNHKYYKNCHQPSLLLPYRENRSLQQLINSSFSTIRNDELKCEKCNEAGVYMSRRICAYPEIMLVVLNKCDGYGQKRVGLKVEVPKVLSVKQITKFQELKKDENLTHIFESCPISPMVSDVKQSPVIQKSSSIVKLATSFPENLTMSQPWNDEKHTTVETWPIDPLDKRSLSFVEDDLDAKISTPIFDGSTSTELANSDNKSTVKTLPMSPIISNDKNLSTIEKDQTDARSLAPMAVVSSFIGSGNYKEIARDNSWPGSPISIDVRKSLTAQSDDIAVKMSTPVAENSTPFQYGPFDKNSSSPLSPIPKDSESKYDDDDNPDIYVSTCPPIVSSTHVQNRFRTTPRSRKPTLAWLAKMKPKIQKQVVVDRRRKPVFNRPNSGICRSRLPEVKPTFTVKSTPTPSKSEKSIKIAEDLVDFNKPVKIGKDQYCEVEIARDSFYTSILISPETELMQDRTILTKTSAASFQKPNESTASSLVVLNTEIAATIPFEPLSDISEIRAILDDLKIDIDEKALICHLEKFPKEIIEFDIATAPKGIQEVGADGNCFYRTISWLLTGSESHHLRIRQANVDFISTNASVFRKLSDESIELFVEKSRIVNTWASEIEVIGLCTLFRCDIFTFLNGKWIRYMPKVLESVKRKGALYIRNKSEVHYEPVYGIIDEFRMEKRRNSSHLKDEAVVEKKMKLLGGASQNFGVKDNGENMKTLDQPKKLYIKELEPVFGDAAIDAYILSSVICHIGDSNANGHYKVYTRNSTTGEWLLCSDEMVYPVKEIEVLKNAAENGYNMYYTRKPSK